MKLQLKQNGYLPFLPVVLPFAAIAVLIAAVVSSRPFVDVWPFHVAIGVVGSVSWWLWASWRAIQALRTDKGASQYQQLFVGQGDVFACFDSGKCRPEPAGASARLRELALRDSIVDSGDRRKTGSGRNAIVWVRAEDATEPLEREKKRPVSYELF